MNNHQENDSEIEKISIQFIEQEHRLFKIIVNLIEWGFSLDSDRKKASWKAFVFGAILSRGNAGMAGGFLALATLYQTCDTNKLMKEQNSISESMVKSSSFNMTTDVLTQLNKELENPNNKNRSISSLLISQLVSLSHSLKPYDIDGKLLSPEKAYYLYMLSSSNINVKDLQTIYTRGNFKNCDFSNINFNNGYFDYLDVSGSKFYKTKFTNCVLTNVICDSVTIVISDFIDSDLSHSKFSGILDSVRYFDSELVNTKFNYCKLKRCNFLDANLTITSFNKSSITKSYFFNTNLEKAKACKYNEDPKLKPFERVAGGSTCSTDFQSLSKDLALNADYSFDSIYINAKNEALKSEYFKLFHQIKIDEKAVLLIKK